MNTRTLIIALSLKHNGDFMKIFEDLQFHVKPEEKWITKAEKVKNAITLLDEDYPSSLKDIQKPPFVIYYKGNKDLLNKQNKTAISGSRHPSEYGIKQTECLVDDLIKQDTTIVSGLARGVSRIAHKNTSNTIAVLGCGVEVCYPAGNLDIYESISKNGGLIISEYPNYVQPAPAQFIERNRIIVGLGNNLIVPEADKNSGTTITAQLAILSGKRVSVFPSESPNSACTFLVNAGADLMEVYR